MKVMAPSILIKNKKPIYKKIYKLYSLDTPNNKFLLNMEYLLFHIQRLTMVFFSKIWLDFIGDPRKPDSKLSKKHYSIAFALQYHLKNNVVLDNLHSKYPSKNLVLSEAV